MCRFPFLLLMTALFLVGCKEEKRADSIFYVLDHERTGLHFVNRLTPSDTFNVFKYMYFYNGAGIGCGDFNGDSLPDLFFAANQQENRLYLNKGNLTFRDVTKEAMVPQDGGWSTGVSVVDINGDGLLDIYISRVGNYEGLKSKNQFLIGKGVTKDGVPVFEDEAEKWGVDFSGFSTQAAFFDYDGDGDLDLFLLNHSIHQNGTFAERSRFLGTYHPLSGDRLYRNEGDRFTDVTKQSAIHSSAIGYGLGIAVSDIDLDGYPDLYIGNDFHENDYLYINQRNGTFREEASERLMHTSQFSMGVDVADITNDGFPEIISMDMLPADPYILKRSLGEDDYTTFYMKVRYGYQYQYTRNNLQLNCRNGVFSEGGLYAGVAATDWSWAPLWMDFDNDGAKDLFISNGIPKRLNDIDYVNHVSNEEVQRRINQPNVDAKELRMIEKFPQIKLPNYFFRNKGNATFEDLSAEVDKLVPTFSNGAIYADLDRDGDLDVVVNNIDDAVLVYENNANAAGSKPAVSIHLQGPGKNRDAIGAKLVLFTKDAVRTYEKTPVHGFLSSMEVPLHVGLDKTVVDSCFLIWPDNTYQPLKLDSTQKNLSIVYRPGLPVFDYSKLTSRYHNTTAPVRDITVQAGLQFRHVENPFNEFDREPLIPFMVSREGPALAIGDANGDGLDDVFVGSAKREKSGVFFQEAAGNFRRISVAALDADSTYEDVDACWVDVNGDKLLDLVVASGGNEYYEKDEHLLPRVYLNRGAAGFQKMADAFGDIFITASCVVPADVNGDGHQDLFIGGRAVPWEYGQVPRSYLLLNDGKGKFADATERYNQELGFVGLVKGAQWLDLDKNGKPDLVVTTEWGGIYSFLNNGSRLVRKSITDEKGLWNFALPSDINGDGWIDFVAGNLGLNSRLNGNDKEPVRLYYNDFDGNGKKEQLMTYYVNGKELPFANKDELQKQMPVLKKKFLYAEDFAKAPLSGIFSSAALSGADKLTATNFANAVFINDGKGNFSMQALPWRAQLSTYRDGAVVDANGDQLPDILLMGNFYENNIQMGRYDADYGMLMLNVGGGKFTCSLLNGLEVKGQVRKLKKLTLGTADAFVLAKNNDSVQLIQFQPSNAKKHGSSAIAGIPKR
ncbi:VCBS repeat-containing protein [Flavisolibacter sp. BT320]|nr:VCBS repeat-containing protein [Flavisolibacter longurius]